MKKVFFFAGLILLAGCTNRMVDMTVASTKNYNINSNNFVIGKKVIAEDSYPVIIFPFGVPNIKTAIDKAIEQNRCAVGLSNVVISDLNYAFLFGKIGIQAEGNLIIDRSLTGCDNAG